MFNRRVERRVKTRYNENMKNVFSKKFIAATEEYGTFEKPVPAPCFRRVFRLQTQPKTAELYICGLGFYRLYLNGVEITKGRLAPYIANPDERLYYDRYDLTARLKKGKNVLAVILGNGFLNNEGGAVWNMHRAAFRSAPKLALALFTDGKKRLQADERFRVHPSPIIFDDYRAGEAYDARLKLRGWTGLTYDDGGWKTAIPAVTPKGVPCLPDCEPIRVIKRRKPVQIERTEKGYLYDFGLNGAGVCRLNVRNAERGQKLVLTYGELKKEGALYVDNLCFPDKTPKDIFYKNVYICAGERVERYTPSFVYYGFRYVEIEGLRPDQATEELLTAEYLSSDVESAGSFVCSDELINGIEHATRNSDRANLVYIPTDCPHREKNGWTGDVTLSLTQFLYNYKMEKTLGEWLKNFVAEQKKNGELPSIVPNTGWGYTKCHGPSWDTALAYTVCELYRFTGDETYLKTGADALRKYLGFIKKQRGENGLFDFGLGDWCQAAAKGAAAYDTKRELLSSISVLETAKKSAFVFGKLGKIREQKRAEAFAKSVRAAIRKNYFEKGRLKGEYATQTAYANLVYADIFTEREKPYAVKALASLVEKNGRKMAVGCLGHKRIFRVLSDYGYADLAYEMIRGPHFPSYGYYIERGATALPEFFTELMPEDGLVPKGRGSSYNHHFFGDVSAWFKEYIGGIRINPDYENCNRVVFDFRFIKGLDFAKASYRHSLGVISTRWVRKNGKIEVKITLPKGLAYEIKNTEQENVKWNISN